jgi:hypothetical protein
MERMMICKDCGSPKIENRDQQLCASCNKVWRKTRQVTPQEPAPPIKKRSDIMTKMMAIYRPKAAKFLVGKRCAVFPDQKATQVHHMYTRSIDDFADEWAVNNNMPYLLDERYWLPVSAEGHKKITDDSDWAWRNGFSFKRVADKMFQRTVND